MNLLYFILNNKNWEEELQKEPYCLKISRDGEYIMFKYNQLCSDFTNPVVREARGIIFHEPTWECVCHAMDKFGNYGESYCPDIDWSSASVQEKIDGSLVKLWYHNNSWHLSTNGTIDAFKANLDNAKFNTFGDLILYALGDKEVHLQYLCKDNTYYFELVSPYNRVVIPYDFTDLYFLGYRSKFDNKELKRETCQLAEYFKMPKEFPLSSLKEVKVAADKLPWDEEGYVVCDKYFNRVKIKSPKYVEAHYARTNNCITKEHLVEVILNNEVAEFLTYCSDYEEELNSLRNKMADYRLACDKAYVSTLLYRFQDEKQQKNRKEIAEYVLANHKKYSNHIFACLDGKEEPNKKFSAKDWVRTLENCGYI